MAAPNIGCLKTQKYPGSDQLQIGYGIDRAGDLTLYLKYRNKPSY
jgi:hypothetical protein